MRNLTRIRTNKAIPASFRSKNRIKWNLELLKRQRNIVEVATKGKVVKHLFKEKRWKVCKDQLLAETHQKCAYCDTPTRVVSYGEVEHYRPKSIYWWLAYCYDNYLVSCISCNQEHKKANFPILGTKMPEPKVTKAMTNKTLETLAPKMTPHPIDASGKEMSDYLNEHKNEQALLLNPYLDDVEAMLVYEADDILKEVEIKISISISNHLQYQKALDNYYGLNRTELKRWRYKEYKTWRTSKSTLKDAGVSRETKLMHELIIEGMQLPDYPYSGMIRYFESTNK